jgi:hypothetical protein
VSPGRKHESLKKKEAGTTGKKEHRVRGKRIDVVKKGKAIEVQTTVTSAGLLKAAQRLKSSGRRQKVLVVPKAEHVPQAAAALRKAKTAGTARTPDKRTKIQVSRPKRKSLWPW